MKIPLLMLVMMPMLGTAADMSLATNVRGLPGDFKRYFYDSEIVTQIYLNDTLLFDAAISLKESGGIQLIRVLDEPGDINPELSSLWEGILREGVSVGECTVSCPSGLLATEYRLDNSVLKLYTSQYETKKTASAFISVPENAPGGLIMTNDVTASGTSASNSWGITSSLTASFSGWSQKASFQSSGTGGRYHYSNSSLYELYSQKELQGSFLRLGLFSPSNDTGNVQTSGFGYDTVTGAMWGTSDALLANTDSVSAWPVYITGRNQSIAEVWRDGRLIYTQQLQQGIQALDTRQLPGGIYDISIKIIVNGQTVETQQAQIYKPQGWGNPDKRLRINLWGGQRTTLATGGTEGAQEHPFSLGGGVDILAHPRAILGFSGAMTGKERQVRSRANITLSQNDTLVAQYTVGNNDYSSRQNTDIHYYRNISGRGSASLFWSSTISDVYGHRTRSRQMGSTWGSSLSLRLPWSTSLILNGQKMDTAWRKGFGADISLTTLATLSGRDMNLRLSAYDRPGFNHNNRDRGLSVGVSFSLYPSARHAVSAETGMNQNQGYSSLNYQWQPGDDGYIRTLGGGVSYSPDSTVISGNGTIDTPYISGDVYAQHDTRGSTNTAGGNLSQVLLLGGGEIASANGNSSRSMESALIIDVESDDKDARIIASGDMAENTLSVGRNIIPTELWKKSNVQFSAGGGDNITVFPERQSVQMNRGSVKYVKLKAVKSFSLVGMLKDNRGQVLKNRYVSSDVSGGMVNAEGVLTLDSGINNGRLNIRAENGLPALQCTLPIDTSWDKNKKVQFIDDIQCDVTVGVNK